jgi:hypothetical protein
MILYSMILYGSKLNKSSQGKNNKQNTKENCIEEQNQAKKKTEKQE